jgi:GTP-binding protein
MGKKRHGSAGDDLVVAVPEGTVVTSQDGEPLADLVTHGDRWQAAQGGQGGRGNARFLSNKRRAPTFAEQGEAGEQRWLELELKLMADVALVGFPNVGKSTLISRISAAKPKIADYPFTTLEPNLGVVRLGDAEFVVADIPGLIEGASEGKGLGHQFLRHIERARVLALLVDLSPTAVQPPAEQEDVLLKELAQYQPDLVERPRVLVGSRADLGDAAEASTDPGADGRAAARLDISAVTGDGLRPLVGQLAELVAGARRAEPEPTGFVIHRPVAEGITVERDDSGDWRIRGRAAERAVALSDITNLEALAYAQHRLGSLGVDKALAHAGAKDGDIVHVGSFSFEYQADDGPG